jgi:hypothetical protein
MTIQFGPADCTGSAIQLYRLYHSTDASMKESFLAGEIKVADVATKPDSEKYKFTFDNPELRLSHYFKITAVNAMGEGPGSDTTEKAVIDFAPRQPSKPIVKKLSSSSVQVSSKVLPNGGSEIDKFKILLSKVTGEGVTSTQEFPVYEFYRGELEYTLSSLEPDTTYEVCVIASNCMGASDPSEKSDPVNLGKLLMLIIFLKTTKMGLDALVPLADPPQLEALPGGTCVKITLPDVSSISKPVIKAFRINWSEDKADFNSPLAATMRLDAAEKSTVVDHLHAGGLFFFAVSLIGAHEGGSLLLFSFIIH